MKLHSNFIKILISQGINPENGREQIVLGSNESTIRFGSIYSEGDWVYNEITGVATRTTCAINNDDMKDIIVRKYVNDDNKIVMISKDYI